MATADGSVMTDTCPGFETVPNKCTCPCEGCKHNCSAHEIDGFVDSKNWVVCRSCNGLGVIEIEYVYGNTYETSYEQCEHCKGEGRWREPRDDS